MSAAATDAPSVTDPSAVISGILKIRKLTYMPNASSARINPSVRAPMSSVMRCRHPREMSCSAPSPAGASHEIGFADTVEGARVGHQMHHRAGEATPQGDCPIVLPNGSSPCWTGRNGKSAAWTCACTPSSPFIGRRNAAA